MKDKKSVDTHTISVRLPESDYQAITETLKGEKGASANNFFLALVEEWKRQHPRKLPKPPSIEQLRNIIAVQISNQLLSNRSWVTDSILDIQLYKDAESIFGERINHFAEEKQLLAHDFVALLVKRIVRQLTEGNRVVLIIDSGTTTYWTFRELEKQLVRISATETGILRNLIIVSNNLAGVDSYMTFSRLSAFTPFGESTQTTLSEFVDCRVLAGRVLTDYAALTGTDTEDALQRLRDEMKDALFIGLVVGNWIRLSTPAPTQYPYPIPLTREHRLHRHKEFKAKLIAVCEEVYILSPLPKLFMSAEGITDEEISTALKVTAYKDVPITSAAGLREAPERIKLISTTRPEGALLEQHSRRLTGLFREANEESCQQFIDGKDIVNVPSLLFPFNRIGQLSLAEQLEIEFPHLYTRDPEFMHKYFLVPISATASA